ncbi:hypothetical protein BpHYR1_034671 [Brachionus plicatilis]|uniref:Uncharacterized protein n=1 Tax=Brachionus plicatilis TaxID=10195 RepID=A0A3M7S1N6_BRAPC|nr:hypothetical protein BpHYR1_034671 [Brachionus plicatilis]
MNNKIFLKKEIKNSIFVCIISNSNVEFKQMDQTESKITVEQPKQKEQGEAGECGPCVETIRCCNLCASCLNNWCFCCRNLKTISVADQSASIITVASVTIKWSVGRKRCCTRIHLTRIIAGVRSTRATT